VVSHSRHIAKAVSWRVIGSADTMLIAWLITGSIQVGAAVGGVEIVTKTVLYYLHERVWYKWIKFGVRDEY
jgi:adenylylsulfate kinase